MTTKKKTIITIVISAAIMVVCAFAIFLAVILANGGADVKFNHIVTEEGLDFSLTRENLTTYAPVAPGKSEWNSDTESKDFSKASEENIFGLSADTVVVPNCRYAADMVITNNSESGGAFAYWLEVKLTGDKNALSEQLTVKVTVAGGEEKTFKLSEGLFLGSEISPVAVVESMRSSAFRVEVRFEDDRTINDDAQGERALFDLIVHAVKI